MYVVFVTGGLASGKKTVCELLGKAGATVLDLDAIAKEEQEDEQILAQLTEAFGDDLLNANGTLDRRLLAERAFATPEDAERLNSICWPAVSERLSDIVLGGGCQMRNSNELVVVEIPLLVESGGFRDLADEVICVVAHEDIRRARAQARGMSPADVENRLALQATAAERIAISDVVIENNDSLAALEEQVNGWLAAHRARLEL
ncbi:MAG: dephospho-CoA kinase [Coriobacteriales bacterium]|jgi:dephospho-CoA kinase|nr:dephospho-CoA kinase [Coriobacteriales bacterium]